jgi:hypothetical protein
MWRQTRGVGHVAMGDRVGEGDSGGEAEDRVVLAERLLTAWNASASGDTVRANELATAVADSGEPALAANAYHLLGLIQLRSGAKDRAIELLSRAVDAGEMNAAYALGATLADAGRLDEAAQAMTAAATTAGAARAADVFLARLQMARHDLAGAVSATTAAMRLSPAAGDGSNSTMAIDPEDWFQLATALHQAGQYELSAGCFEECAKVAGEAMAETARTNAEWLRAAVAGAAAPSDQVESSAVGDVLGKVASGSLDADQALLEINSGPEELSITDAAAEQWLTHASDLLSGARWTDAVAIARTIRAASRHSQAGWTDRYLTDLRLVSFSVRALRELPHPELYALARDAADEAVEFATSAGDVDRRSEALLARAGLHTGPLLSLQSMEDVENRDRMWRESLAQQLGQAGAAAARARHSDFPPLEQALGLAERDLVAAMGAMNERLVASVHGNLSEVLIWRLRFAPAAEHVQLRARCEEHARRALTSIDANRDPAAAARLLQTLIICEAEPDTEMLAGLLDISLDEWKRRLNQDELLSLVQQLVNILFDSDPARGLALLREAQVLLEQAPESVRKSCWMKELLLIAALSGARFPYGETAITAVDLEGDARLRGARMVAATLALTGLARPHDARQMLDRFKSTAPVLASLHADAIGYARTVIAELLLMRDVERDARASAAHAAAMLDFYTSHRLRSHTANVLYQLSLLAAKRDAVPIILEALRVNGLRASSLLGERATDLMLRIHNQALATLYNEEQKSTEVWLHLIQQIGGARFSAALASGTSYRVPPGTAPILDKIRELATQNPAAIGGTATEDELLTAHAAEDAELPGADDYERLANLRQRFDRLANRDLADRAAEHSGDRLYLDEVGSSIGGRTVVVQLITQPKSDGSTIIIGTCITADGMTVDGMESVFPVTSPDRSGLPGLAAHVIELRRLLLQPGDGPLPVSVGAAAMLEEDLVRLIPQSCREALRHAREAGQDHLLIVPHGPLHYYPLHLLGPVSDPLCDTWKVSYVPTLAALGPRRAPSIFDAARTPMTAIGLSFGDRADVDVKLPSAVEQAQEIAALFGATALVESDATKGQVITALRTSSRVHLATHGRNSVTAPSFQSLLVAPSRDGSDREIATWELGQLDLRGVEIITTAVCETGLGRFDQLDNLLGLPAALFLSGVQSMTTTLWPVGADSSRTFFTAFYSRLQTGASRIDAFAEAQRVTRSLAPEFRRWAGYTLSGSWT